LRASLKFSHVILEFRPCPFFNGIGAAAVEVDVAMDVAVDDGGAGVVVDAELQ